MTYRPLIFAALCMAGLSQLDAASTSTFHHYTRERAQAPTIRILVANDIPQANLQVVGNYNLVDPHQGNILGRRMYGKQRVIEPLPSGLKWGEEFPAIYQLKFVPGSPETNIIVNGTAYRGNVTIYDIGGTISIINEVPIEEYVAGHLAAHVNEMLPEEAFAALAIAARSNAYYQAIHPQNRYWDVDASVVGYEGDVNLSEDHLAQQAVNATRFMVLTQPNNSPGDVDVVLAPWSQDPATGKAKDALQVSDAAAQADAGNHAAQILQSRFPVAVIQRIYDNQ